METIAIFCCSGFMLTFTILYYGVQLAYGVLDMLYASFVIFEICYNTESGIFSQENCRIVTSIIYLDRILIGCASINMIIWFICSLIYFNLCKRQDTAVTDIKSENENLQTELTNKILEIANLQRQLNNERNDRRFDNSLPPYAEQENERGRLLTINRLPDYQTVQ